MDISKKVLSVIMVISILFCLSGCRKSESEYKSAISEHLRSVHSMSVNSYNSFSIDNSGSARADVNVTARLAYDSNGFAILRCEFTVDKDCNVSYCSLCEYGY